MYSREESTQLRQQFWTVFGQYMAPVPSAEGEKINWINYKTGEKGLQFKMKATNKEAFIGIVLTDSDAGMQQIYFEQFAAMKNLLHQATGEEWTWALHTSDEDGRLQSRIYTTCKGVSIYNKADWPALIQFFKQRIIALDAFWSNAKYAFEALRF